MYGYVVPPKKTLSLEDYALFNSFYCGTCICTGKLMGQRARFATNYDITFLNLLLHDLLSQDVTFEVRGCVFNPKKRPTVKANELMNKIIAANIILSYYKAEDGVVDGDGIKYGVAKRSLKSSYKKAKEILPEADAIVKCKYETLRSLEQANTIGIDKVSDVFASMLMEVAALLLGDKSCDDSLKLIYNIGKFVYLVDALDDIDDDYKAKRYNPFLAELSYNGRERFFAENAEFIGFVLNITVNRAIECFNNLLFTQSYDLLKKIVHIGLRQKVDELLSSKKKLKKPIIKEKINEKSV